MVRQADWIICLSNDAYRERWQGEGDPKKGYGAYAEIAAIRALFEENRQEAAGRVTFVTLPGENRIAIPAEMRGWESQTVSEFTIKGLEGLLRKIHKLPVNRPREVGEIPSDLFDLEDGGGKYPAPPIGGIGELQIDPKLIRMEGVSPVKSEYRSLPPDGESAVIIGFPDRSRVRYRDDDIERLAVRRDVSMTVLTGLAGVGKSALAAEYAMRKQAHFGGIIWVDGNSAVSAIRDLADAANQFCPGIDFRAGVEERARSFLEFAALTSEKLLCVYDGVADPSVVTQWVPHGANIQIIVTTRDASMANQGTRVPVEPWSVKTGAEYLLDMTTSDGQANAELLAGRLGGIPLAIDQAASYILDREITVEQYLPLLQERPRDALSARVPGYSSTIFAVMELILSGLGYRDPDSAAMLRCASLLGPRISRDLLIEASVHAGCAISSDVAMSRLTNLSLLVERAGGKECSLNELVELLVLERMSKTERKIIAEASLAALDDLYSTDRAEDQDERYRLAGSLERFYELADVDELNDKLLRLVGRHQTFLLETGQNLAALRIGRRLVDDCIGIYGTDDDATIRAMMNLDFCLFVMKRFNEAVRIEQRLIRILRERPGGTSNDEFALGIRRNLATSYLCDGSTSTALSYMDDVLTDAKIFLGDDSPFVESTENILHQMQHGSFQSATARYNTQSEEG